MFIKSLKITLVSGFNFLIKNSIVFIVFDISKNDSEYLYIFILIYMYFQSYILHLKFTFKKEIGIESFTLFLKLNIILFLVDYFIFSLINQLFPYVVLSTILISIIIHLIRIILFSKEMN